MSDRFHIHYVHYYEPNRPQHNYVCHVIVDDERKTAYPFETESQAKAQLENVQKGDLDYLEKFGFVGGPVATTCVFLNPVSEDKTAIKTPGITAFMNKRLTPAIPPTPTVAATPAPKSKRKGGRKPVDRQREYVSVKLPKAFQGGMTKEYFDKRAHMLAKILIHDCPADFVQSLFADLTKWQYEQNADLPHWKK